MDSSIYKRIMDYLLEIINRNANIPNYKLPSERMLAANFDSSRKPVRHAYEQLIERGYVTNIPGMGILFAATSNRTSCCRHSKKHPHFFHYPIRSDTLCARNPCRCRRFLRGQPCRIHHSRQ